MSNEEYYNLQRKADLTELDILRNNVRDLQKQLQAAYIRIDELNQKIKDTK